MITGNPIVDSVIGIELLVLLFLPIPSLLSLLFLWKLVPPVHPPVLLVLLVMSAGSKFLTTVYFAFLILNVRFLGGTNPPQLVPVTLLMLILPFSMINIIAFVLWRKNK